ncbi:alpha/beta hydrolase [Diaphorobacter sp.]|uniref:alpha/beta fold hydrolase n=1 Tax=Diaphorobacter sp. TaxID=1934310 RepID=UPI0028AAAAF8|nr:alpha/beta hydrolase [Diaphorobacter sp.]
MRRYELPDYNVTGEGNTTVYLLHGAYGSKEYWRFTAKELVDAGYRVIAWDAPGYGVSPTHTPLSITYLAELVAKLIDHTKSAKTVVLGHSMGGMVAQKLYDLRPELLNALVLSETAHTFNHSGPEWQKDFLLTRVAPLTSGRKIREYAPQLLQSMMGPGASGPIVDHVLYNICLMQEEGFAAAIKATSEFLEEDIIGRVNIPLLCIAGELDLTCPASVMKKMAELGNGEFHEMKGVGHYGWAERPDEYHAVLLDFLNRQVPAA